MLSGDFNDHHDDDDDDHDDNGSDEDDGDENHFNIGNITLCTRNIRVCIQALTSNPKVLG